MPVDAKHKQHEARLEQWTRCRDTVEGTDAIKKRGGLYLPLLSGQDATEYNAYRNRAMFYGATSRTVDGLSGAVFRKQYILEYPESKLEELEDITEESSTIEVLLRSTVREVLTTGRHGLLVDSTPSEEGDTRSYIAQYKAENILNWRVARVNGANMLVHLTLAETYETEGDDEYERVEKDQIRVLMLTQPTEVAEGEPQHAGPIYRQELHRKNDKGQWIITESTTPTRAGKPLEFIPFKFINATNDEPTPVKPPLLDMVDVNLSHYRTSADLEHGAHFTALPTPVLSGFDVKHKYRIGSGTAWVSENPQARAMYLEYTGQGLQALRDLRKDKEGLMAILGARLLEEQKRAAEAAETHKLRASAESGSLAAMVGVIEEACTQVLQWHAEWSAGTDAGVSNIELTLNKDFVSARLGAQDITALMKARQSGELSQDSFLWNLKEGEILPDDTSIEEEKDRIEVDGNNSGDNLQGDVAPTPIKRSFDLVRGADGKASGIKEA
jgi:hypothetical protein